MSQIQRGLDKIEAINGEKRKAKRSLKAWNSAFEKQFGRPASQAEKRQLASDYYAEYQRLARQLEAREDKVRAVLARLGISFDEFVALRDELEA